MIKDCLESLNVIESPEYLQLLLNIWLYYDATDFLTRSYVFQVLKKNKAKSILAIEKRQKNKKDWESKNRCTIF